MSSLSTTTNPDPIPRDLTPPDLTVADVARRGARATRVLARHGVDFCCGGERSLRDACARLGVDPAQLLAEVEGEAAAEDEVDWMSAPLGDVIAHILTRFHRPLDEELPRLGAMVRKVVRVHGDKDPARFAGLAEAFAALVGELVPHMQKEERVLFPWILSGRGASAGAPVRVMEAEHDHAGELLRRIRALTDDYTPPEGACGTWRALWAGLEELEADLHAHIHLENNVLFPRALRGE